MTSDSIISKVWSSEREIDAALRQSEALRQSIRKKAFTGRLVPQGPSDEAAGELLDRLKRERATKAVEAATRVPRRGNRRLAGAAKN